MTRQRRAWPAVLLAAAFLTGCTFSTGKTTEVTELQQGAAATTGAAPSGAGGSSSQGSPSGVGASTSAAGSKTTPLCRGLQEVYLANLSDQHGAATLLTRLGQVSALAPTGLKPAINTLGAYLLAAAKGDLATAKGSAGQVDAALSRIDRYVTDTCHA